MIGIGFLGVTADGRTPGLPQNCMFDGAPCGGSTAATPTRHRHKHRR
ncbi:MAG TPA: hypothetical protein VGJ28_11065 [Micromonosporaceae bacterium]